MKIINRHHLPATVVNAIKQVQSEYTGGSSYVSASSITKSPRIFHLERRHRDKITQDAADLVFSLIGTLIHGVLEKAALYTEGAKAEQRLFKEVNGVIFSGQYDLVEKDTLYDYKVTSICSVMGEPKLEWIAQANCNRLLLHEADVEINKLEIVAILRDWSLMKVKTDAEYPKTQVKRVKLPVWPLEQTDKYLKDRISLLQSHESTPDDDLPPCTAEDMWERPTQFAVMKKGGKRAIKLFDVGFEADIYLKQKGIDGYVEVRPGERVRCENYCSVAQFCNQYKEYREKQG